MTTIISDASRVVNTPAPSGRFILVPEELIFSSLSDRAFRVACAHLTYARADRQTTWPAQETLAERLDRSPDSIQRAEAELQDAGIVRAEQTRRAGGVFGKRIVDLSPVFDLLPSGDRAANLRSGSQHSSPSPRRKSAVSGSRTISSVEETEQTAPVVAILTDLGVPEQIAAALAPVALKAQRTPEQIRSIVREWRRQGEKVKNARGWLRRAIEQGYQPASAPERYERPVRVVRDPKPPAMPTPPQVERFAATGEEARARARQFLGLRATV